MKIENTGQEEIDLGFEVHAEGTYLFQIDEGVELTTNEETGSQTLRVPFVSKDCREGDQDSVGRKVMMFINVIKKDGEENDFGGKQINNILTMTGLADSFAKNMPGDIAINSEKFIDHLKLKLPGKWIGGTITHKKNLAGDGVNAQFQKLFSVGANKESAPQKSPAQTESWS